MPALMPTPDELQRIPRHKRERIQRAIHSILTGIDAVAETAASRALTQRQFGDDVMNQARILEQTEPRDSPTDIAQRRIELLLAVTHNCGSDVDRRRIVREANAIPIHHA